MIGNGLQRRCIWVIQAGVAVEALREQKPEGRR